MIHIETEPVKRVLAVMRSAAFHEALAGLPGYAAKDAGVVKTLNEAFNGST